MKTSPIYFPESAPYNGPQSLSAELFDSISSAPYEGVWIPIHCVKKASVDISGTDSASSVQIVGSNSISAPLNTYTVTVGGTITTNDVVTLRFDAGLIQSGPVNISYTVAGGDSTTSIATALKTAINANASIIQIGIVASSVGAVLTINWPSISSYVPNSFTPASPTNPTLKNNLALSGSVSGYATETVTVACGTDGSALQLSTGSSATIGLNYISQLPVRWIKGRLTSVTGGSISATFHGVL